MISKYLKIVESRYSEKYRLKQTRDVKILDITMPIVISPIKSQKWSIKKGTKRQNKEQSWLRIRVENVIRHLKFFEVDPRFASRKMAWVICQNN